MPTTFVAPKSCCHDARQPELIARYVFVGVSTSASVPRSAWPRCAASAPQQRWRSTASSWRNLLATACNADMARPSIASALQPASTTVEQSLALPSRSAGGREVMARPSRLSRCRSDEGNQRRARIAIETTCEPTCRRDARRAKRPLPVSRARPWCLRVNSSASTKLTLGGHARSQRPHARQRSREGWAGLSSSPAATLAINASRPRGESASLRVTAYVGQCGRHSPHITHCAAMAAMRWSGVEPVNACDMVLQEAWNARCRTQ